MRNRKYETVDLIPAIGLLLCCIALFVGLYWAAYIVGYRECGMEGVMWVTVALILNLAGPALIMYLLNKNDE